MINSTIEKIQNKIQNSKAISDDNKSEFLNLVSELKSEISSLSDNNSEQAESIANYANSSTHEAIKINQNKDLLDNSLNGLNVAVAEFETTHPKLTKVVNSISVMLSNLGI